MESPETSSESIVFITFGFSKLWQVDRILGFANVYMYLPTSMYEQDVT